MDARTSACCHAPQIKKRRLACGNGFGDIGLLQWTITFFGEYAQGVEERTGEGVRGIGQEEDPELEVRELGMYPRDAGVACSASRNVWLNITSSPNHSGRLPVH